MEVLCFLPSKHSPLCVFDLRATHARILLPAALASVSFGFCISSSSSSSGLRASFEIRKLNAKKKTVSFAYFLGDTEKNL